MTEPRTLTLPPESAHILDDNLVITRTPDGFIRRNPVTGALLAVVVESGGAA